MHGNYDFIFLSDCVPASMLKVPVWCLFDARVMPFWCLCDVSVPDDCVFDGLYQLCKSMWMSVYASMPACVECLWLVNSLWKYICVWLKEFYRKLWYMYHKNCPKCVKLCVLERIWIAGVSYFQSTSNSRCRSPIRLKNPECIKFCRRLSSTCVCMSVTVSFETSVRPNSIVKS